MIKFMIAAVSIDIGTLITRTPGLHGGCPHIVGKGVTVRRIVTWYKRGLNAEEKCDRIGHKLIILPCYLDKAHQLHCDR